MVREIFGRAADGVVWSALVVAVHKAGVSRSVPSTIHSLVGVAPGLLLVFRTNSSDDRYWEGRRMWGAMVNDSWNLDRLARAHPSAAPDVLDPVLRWTVAYAYAVMHALRNQAALGPVATTLPAREVEEVLAAPNIPLAVATRITTTVRVARDRGIIAETVLLQFELVIKEFLDDGACNRIRRPPLPFAYVVHLRRALILYCFTLPFALVDPFGWSTVLDTLLVTYVFFGIEEIGVEIEDPFGLDDNDLPLEATCASVARRARPPARPAPRRRTDRRRPGPRPTLTVGRRAAPDPWDREESVKSAPGGVGSLCRRRGRGITNHEFVLPPARPAPRGSRPCAAAASRRSSCSWSSPSSPC